MVKKKDGRGGARKSAGRKPLPDSEKKVVLTIYPQQKEVDKFGGLDKAREAASEFIKKGPTSQKK